MGSRSASRTNYTTVDRVLKWAESHHVRTGRWPAERSGRVRDARGDITWHQINLALWQGRTDAPEGTLLRDVLAEHFGVRATHQRQPLSEAKLLRWADRYRRNTGGWPKVTSGIVFESPGDTWSNLDDALRQGSRGLAGGDSLSKLLARRRGARNRSQLPKLTIGRILDWADAHRARTGRWPTTTSGPIIKTNGETWTAVDMALWKGLRGLRGGDSLAKVLYRRRGVRRAQVIPPLTPRQILCWADEHFRRTSLWPRCDSGPVRGAPGEKWYNIDVCLRRGLRGLPKGGSLAVLLASTGRHARLAVNGPKIRSLRLRRGLSVSSVSRQVGWHAPYACGEYETSKRKRMKIEHVRRLADLLGCGPPDLLAAPSQWRTI
ncbi:MAG: hypothetical protein GC159_10910 [Phycisphaera sp.]|nr:hypothetical protein [Phycisphaera sp.]